jgi:hypothetical protein
LAGGSAAMVMRKSRFEVYGREVLRAAHEMMLRMVTNLERCWTTV